MNSLQSITPNGLPVTDWNVFKASVSILVASDAAITSLFKTISRKEDLSEEEQSQAVKTLAHLNTVKVKLAKKIERLIL